MRFPEGLNTCSGANGRNESQPSQFSIGLHSVLVKPLGVFDPKNSLRSRNETTRIHRKPHQETKMSSPEIAQKAPYVVEVESGKTYWWCSCGKSQSQPFCDGSHKGTGFSPVEYKASKDEKVWFCGCKHSLKGALCDGQHKNL